MLYFLLLLSILFLRDEDFGDAEAGDLTLALTESGSSSLNRSGSSITNIVDDDDDDDLDWGDDDDWGDEEGEDGEELGATKDCSSSSTVRGRRGMAPSLPLSSFAS